MTNEQRRTIIFIVLGLFFGLVAVVLVSNYLQGEANRRDEILKTEMEKNNKVLEEKISAQIDAKVNAQMGILERKMAVSPERPAIVPQNSLALKTPPGKRAVTVKIDSLSAVGGLINPGDFVDVLAQITPQPSPSGLQPRTITVIVFQNVQILAIGTNVASPGIYEQQQQARDLTVTFALSPEESGLLSFVQQNGRLQLALRSPSETETYTLPMANWQTLSDYVLEKQGTDLGTTNTKAFIEPSTEEAKPYIQIFRGGREL